MPRATIFLVDDDRAISEMLQIVLEREDYQVTLFSTEQALLARLAEEIPSVVISDVTMPEMDGYELCRQIRSRFAHKVIPIILVTGHNPAEERVHGLEAGADDFLRKPIELAELFARVRSLVRISELHERIEKQSLALEEWGKQLERRVQEQVDQLGQLKRFFSPQVAELVSSSTGQNLIRLHRKEVTVCFFDLRGFTAFTERYEPEKVMRVLNEYYAGVGNLVLAHQGTIGSFTGDGMMCFFNDPTDIPTHEGKAVRMALAARQVLIDLRGKWTELGYGLDFGIGIAAGYETIGQIGFEKCWDYSVIGSTTNTASRLCDEAQSGQILVSDRFFRRFCEPGFEAESLGDRKLKGIEHPVIIHNIIRIAE